MLMMIGHGTFDGTEYKFNLPGPDISAPELAALLNTIPAGRQLVVDMTSASGGAISALKKDNRTIITATKSGTEKNATVFARFWVEALRDPAADVDKNETISALEAFQYARKEDRAVLFRSRSGWRRSIRSWTISSARRRFRCCKFGSASAVVTDPAKRELVAKKDDIENKIDALKYQKSLMAPDDYKKSADGLAD